MADESGTLLQIQSGLPFKQAQLRFDNFLVHEPDTAVIQFVIGWDSNSRDPLVDPTTGAVVGDPPSDVRTVPASSTLLSFSLRPTTDSGGQGRHLSTMDGETVSYFIEVWLNYGPGTAPIEIIGIRRFDIDYNDPDPVDLGVQWDTP